MMNVPPELLARPEPAGEVVAVFVGHAEHVPTEVDAASPGLVADAELWNIVKSIKIETAKLNVRLVDYHI